MDALVHRLDRLGSFGGARAEPMASCCSRTLRQPGSFGGAPARADGAAGSRSWGHSVAPRMPVSEVLRSGVIRWRGRRLEDGNQEPFLGSSGGAAAGVIRWRSVASGGFAGMGSFGGAIDILGSFGGAGINRWRQSVRRPLRTSGIIRWRLRGINQWRLRATDAELSGGVNRWRAGVLHRRAPGRIAPPLGPRFPGVNHWRSGVHRWHGWGQQVAELGSITGAADGDNTSRSQSAQGNGRCGEPAPCSSSCSYSCVEQDFLTQPQSTSA